MDILIMSPSTRHRIVTSRPASGMHATDTTARVHRPRLVEVGVTTMHGTILVTSHMRSTVEPVAMATTTATVMCSHEAAVAEIAGLLHLLIGTAIRTVTNVNAPPFGLQSGNWTGTERAIIACRTAEQKVAVPTLRRRHHHVTLSTITTTTTTTLRGHSPSTGWEVSVSIVKNGARTPTIGSRSMLHI